MSLYKKKRLRGVPTVPTSVTKTDEDNEKKSRGVAALETKRFICLS